MDGPKSVTANYSLNTYALSVTSAHGTVTKAPDQASYDHGTSVQLTAAPATGYTFVNWTGDVTSSENPVTLTMDGPKSVTANYSLSTYTLAITAINGTVTKNPDQASYDHGTSVLLTASAATSYHFVNWSGNASGSDNPLTVIMEANTAITANFAINTYTLTYIPGENGSITGSATQSVNHGANGTEVVAVPTPQFHFVSWSDGVVTPARTDLNVTADLTVTATFAIDTFTLTYTPGPNGTITGISPQTVNFGANGSEVTAVPDAHHHFVSWSDGVLTAARTDLNVLSDISVTADFAIDTHTLTIAAVNGTVTKVPDQPSYDYGTIVELTASASPGHHFVNWTGDATGSNTLTTVNMDADKSVTANFAVDTIPVTERDALIALYDSTNGNSWTNSSGWKTPPLDTDGFAMPGTEGSWYGISIDAGSLRVTSIDLSNNNLTGTIPTDIGSFSNLHVLHLFKNSIGGSIPAEMGDLSNLQDLNLSENRLSGTIPTALGNLSNLQHLYLSLNQLSGPIPPELGNLGNDMLSFSLSGNQLSGPIPASLANLTALNPAGTDFGYNALYTADSALIAFLNSKDPDWASTQTIAPTGITATALDNAVILVSWLPVTYTADEGYSIVSISQTLGGPYTFAGQTADKATTAVNVTGLTPGQRYYFVVQTHTNAHANNPNAVESAYSAEATAVAWLQISVQITGTVTVGGLPLPGVVMTGLTGSPVTNTEGVYTGTEAVDWSGTVTPVLAGYTFAPVSNSYSHLTADQTAQNYAATHMTFTISGAVTSNSIGVPGVTLAGLPGNPVTGADGSYTATVNYGFSGTVTPTHAQYTFDPALKTYTDVTADHLAEGYIATEIVMPTITVTSPNGGETWSVGSTHTITWTQTGLTGAVTIDLYKGGVFLKILGTPDAAVGTFDWAIETTEAAGTDYTVLIWQNSVSDTSDADFALMRPAVRVDFNKDGQEDVLWRYYGTGGSNLVWFLGDAGLAGQPLVLANPQASATPTISPLAGNLAWGKMSSIVRDLGVNKNPKDRLETSDSQDMAGIMNRRGAPSQVLKDPRHASKSRVLGSPWRYSDPRQAVPTAESQALADNTAKMAAAGVVESVELSPVSDLNWEINGTGDFNRDGDIDILWRYNAPGGYVVVWYMTGTEVTGIGVMPEVTDLNWQIAGTGDFNLDGNIDILWRYNAPGGYVVVWYMNGTNVTGIGVMPEVTDLNWQLVGTGDFNNDTSVDILWRYNGPGGSNVVWYMDGTYVSGIGVMPEVTDLNWQIVGIGDFNNDTFVDILWRHNGAGGDNVIWYMNVMDPTGLAVLSPMPDLNWKIVNR